MSDSLQSEEKATNECVCYHVVEAHRDKEENRKFDGEDFTDYFARRSGLPDCDANKLRADSSFE